MLFSMMLRCCRRANKVRVAVLAASTNLKTCHLKSHVAQALNWCEPTHSSKARCRLKKRANMHHVAGHALIPRNTTWSSVTLYLLALPWALSGRFDTAVLRHIAVPHTETHLTFKLYFELSKTTSHGNIKTRGSAPSCRQVRRPTMHS